MSRLALLVALAATLVSCRKETIDKPDGPGMNDVLDGFASPSGTFDQSSAAAIRSSVDGAVGGLLGAGLTDRLVAVVQDAVRESQKTDTKSQAKTTTIRPLGFAGEGFARVTRICDGWGPAPVPDEGANGHLELTLTFDQTRLDPVIWGDAERCLYLLGGKRISLARGPSQSDLRLYIGEGSSLEQLATIPLVLALDVVATLDDKPVVGKLAVRFVYKAAEVELLVPVADGDVVVSVSGGNALRVRAKNGSFECDAATRVCKGGASGDVTL